MKSKDIKFAPDSWNALQRGVDTTVNAVKITLGPNGKNVIIERKNGSPDITKDGVTVVKSLELSDYYENLACQIIKDTAIKTVEEAGDGTTTVCILVQAMVEKTVEKIKGNNASQIHITRGISKAMTDVLDKIAIDSRPAKELSELVNIATISSNNDKEMGKIIGEMVHSVGEDGEISFQESPTEKTFFEMTKGITFGEGFPNKYFITDQKRGMCIMDDCYVFVTDQKIEVITPLIKLIEAVMHSKKPLLIIADDFSREVIQLFAANKTQGKLQICPIAAPQFTYSKKQSLEDIAMLTGTKVINAENDLHFESVSLADLGSAKRVEIKRTNCTIIEGKKNEAEFNDIITSLDAELKETKEKYRKDFLRQRKSKLTGNVGILFVGGNISSEVGHTKDRVDDAVAACKAALSNGIMQGSGNYMVRLSQALSKLEFPNMSDDELVGKEILCQALLEPFRILCVNGGEDFNKTKKKLLDSDQTMGIDFTTMEIVNLVEKGIIDPTLVITSTIKNAVSAAIMMLNSGCLIVEPEDIFDVKTAEN